MGAIERRRILAEAQGRVLLVRRRIELMKQAYENDKGILQEGTFSNNRDQDFNFADLVSLL